MRNESPDSMKTGPALASAFWTLRTVADYARVLVITLIAAFLLKLLVIEAFRIPSPSMERTLLVGDFILVNKLAYGIRSPLRIPFTGIELPRLVVPPWVRVRRGDVLVFEFPGTAEEIEPEKRVSFVKRCVGLPGDIVEIREGRVFVNGMALGSPRTGMGTGDLHSAWRPSANFYPPGSMYSNIQYGPLRVPRKGDTIEITGRTIEQWRVFLEREGYRIDRRFDAVLVDGQPASRVIVRKDYYFVLGDNRDNSLDSRFWGFVPDDNVVGEALAIYWSWDPAVPVTNTREKLTSIRWNRIMTIVR